MKIIKTNFKGLKIIQGLNHKDKRGIFREIYKNKTLKIHKPIFWCLSNSKKNVLRGLHLQINYPQEKYVCVIKGKILDVVVDLRKHSKTFGKHFKIILSEKKCNSLLIPAGFAHGFLTLDDENIVLYSNNNYRSKQNEIGIKWNDQDLNIDWPKKRFKISKKDKNNLSFNIFNSKYLKKNG